MLKSDNSENIYNTYVPLKCIYYLSLQSCYCESKNHNALNL